MNADEPGAGPAESMRVGWLRDCRAQGRIQDGPRTCVYSGRLQKYGKSKRSGAPADGHRSDSPGIFYKFPAQRSSGSVREALRLSRPTGLLNVKIFHVFAAARCTRLPPVPACFRPFLPEEPPTNFLTFPRECDTLNSVYNVDQTEAYEVKTLDKAEYQSKLEQLTSLANKEDYKGALEIVESVDWRRVKSIRTLSMVADVYEANKMYPEANDILLLAYDRSSIGKGILYRLVEVSVKMQDFESAEEYYEEFVSAAPHDTSRYLLRYKILRGQQAPLDEQIKVLEAYKEAEFTERWNYELALLYSKNGQIRQCVDTCDELELWFSEGKYVTKALELKMKYEPLTPSQKSKYENGGAASSEKEVGNLLNRMDQAGAAITQDAGAQEMAAARETEAGKEAEPAPSYTAPTFLGNTVDLHNELIKSIRNVFPDVKKTAQAEQEASEPEENREEDYDVRELEPENMDVEVAPQPDADKTILTRPETVKKETPKAEAVKEEEPETAEKPAETSSADDLDLDALFQETAASLSDEIAHDSALEKAEEELEEDDTEQPENLSAEDSVEEESPIRRLEDLEKTMEIPEPVIVQPEDLDMEIPQEPSQEAAKDATKVMTVENTADRTIEMPSDVRKEETVPMSIEEVLREETPEERRMRILNDTQPEKLNDEQKALFTYFAKVPGMDQQILDAMHGVYHYAGDRTSRHGNIAIMGGYGTGKTRLSEGLVRAICVDLKIPATKMARLDAAELNRKDPAQVVAKLAGGFLLIERAGLMYPETIEKLSKAMDFRTDSLILIIEDEKTSMRGMFHNYPEFAKKFETVISIPVFTNDELVTFARTYARENGYKMDEMGVLALYTQIGDNQKEGEPMTITNVKDMVDKAIAHAEKGTRKLGRKVSRKHRDSDDRVILYEKDFDF